MISPYHFHPTNGGPSDFNGRGNATTNEYDSLGRLASVTDAAGSTTRYAYDEIGNLAAITNALGVATVYEYDLRGNKIYEGGGTYPVSYAYNGENRPVSWTCGSTNITMKFDRMGLQEYDRLAQLWGVGGFFQWLCPSRRVKRARWTLSGSGECDCEERR